MNVIEEFRTRLKSAVLQSKRNMEWEPGRRHNSQSWRIKRRGQAAYVYVWWEPFDGGRYAITHTDNNGVGQKSYCESPYDAVALAERIADGRV